MKKIIFIIFILFPTILFAENSELNNNHKLTIGLSIPISGALQEYGAAVRNAFFLAEKDTNSTNHEFIFQDNKYDGKSSLSSFKFLTHAKNVDIIYLWGEICLSSIASLTNSQKTPILTMSVDKRPAKNNKFILRTINPSSDFVKVLYSYLRSKSLTKIGILMTDDSYFEGLLEELENQKNELELLNIVAKVSPDKMDFKTELLKAKRNNFDALGLYLFPGQVSSAFRTARTFNMNNILKFGTDIFESRTEVKDSNNTMYDAVYPNLDIPEEFSNRYIKEFGNDLQISYAYNAYVTAYFLLSNIELFTNKKNEDLLNTIIETSMKQKNTPFLLKNEAEYGHYFSFPIKMKNITSDGFQALN